MIKLEEVFDLNKVKFTDEELEAPYEDNKEEIWRDIAGYEGLYQVSNIGRVKSLERSVSGRNGSKRHKKELILKSKTDRYGYLQVALYDDSGKRKNFLVHRLVCKAFHENPENKPCVNHIDENKVNNAESNLEWCTFKENCNHGTHNVRVSKAVAKALSKPVGQYTRDGKLLIKVWQSALEVQKYLGFAQSNISAAARGKQKTSHGYVWKYIDED